FMRQLNMNYAIYFNKKCRRSGHLWQGRFKSWYVTDEAYLYTLMLYIEQNPLKAKMVKDMKENPYSSYNYFLASEIPECLQQSWIAQKYGSDSEAITDMLNSPIEMSQLSEMKKAASLVEAPNIEKKPNEKKLKQMFKKVKELKERNSIIIQAYKGGYSQQMIAKVLEITQQAVFAMIKRSRK
ncbi:MAG: hypothetical protein U9R27_10260, partial [Campylobacterota bacterium]|nr:hypothetical protein [Campylobacterota bacterium]